jgi:acetyl-CoA C-acetyltransferase
MMVERIVVAAAARTAFGRLGGTFRDRDAIGLGALVVRELLRRSQLPPDQVDFVVMGNVLPTNGMTPTRQVALTAGLSITTTSLTIDRACCSAMTAIGIARSELLAGQANVAIAGGTEAMSATPYLIRGRWGRAVGVPEVEDPLLMVNEHLREPRVRYVAQTALERGEDRRSQDEWSVESHHRYEAAWQGGKFADEIMPVDTAGGPFCRDEQSRPGVTLERLSELPTVYGSETITAGNATGLNDGAAAVLVTTESRARSLGLEPLAYLVSYAAISGEPRRSIELPARAIAKALKSTELHARDLELFQVNEPYAATALVTTQELAGMTGRSVADVRANTNVNGDAIAIGHPIGASGARVLMALIYELRRRGGGYGAAAICGGIGQSDALLVRVA